jgi:hypothetical protein
MEGTAMAAIDPLTAGGVLLATALTDAVYVMFTSAVVARKRVPAATWSSIWYLLSSYAVISYTENWVYVAFAAIGSWLGAFASITFLHRPPDRRRAGDLDTPARSRGADRVRVRMTFLPLENRGRRECRAPSAPAASCAK